MEKVLFDYLDHEIKISTGCSLSAADWNLNIFRLSGKGREAAILCGDHKPLIVKTLEGNFSLKILLTGKIILDLKLMDVSAESFLPGSELFKFVEYLSEDSLDPPLIRLFLRQMAVSDFQAKDTLHQQPVSVFVKELSYFRKNPSLLHLSFNIPSTIWNFVETTDIFADLDITDDTAKVSKFRAKLGDKTINLEGLVFPFVKFEGFVANATQSGFFTLDAEGDFIKVKTDLRFDGLKVLSYEFENVSLRSDGVFHKNPSKFLSLAGFSSQTAEVKLNLEAARVTLFDNLKIKNLVAEIKKTPNLPIKTKINFEFKDLAFDLNGLLDGSILRLDFKSPFAGSVRVDLEQLEFSATDLIYDELIVSNLAGSAKGQIIEGVFQALGKDFGFVLDNKSFKFKSQDSQIKANFSLESAEFVFKQAKLNFQDKEFSVTGDFRWQNGIWNGLIKEGRLNFSMLNQPLSIDFSGLTVEQNQLRFKKDQLTQLGNFEVSAGGYLNRLSVNLTGTFQLDELFKQYFPEVLVFLPVQVETQVLLQNFSLATFSTRALIEQGFVFDYRNQIFLENIQAKASWRPQDFLAFKLKGTFNNGNFEISGEGNPFELATMKIFGRFKNAVFNRPQLFNLNLGGDFTFDNVLNLNLELKEGWVRVPNPSLLKRIIDRSTETYKPVFTDLLNKVEGKVHVQTLSQIQISTPNIKTSFAGQLEVTNQAGALNFMGGFQSLGGFIKLGANYFEIISGFAQVEKNQLITVNLEAKKTFFYAPRYPVSITTLVEGEVFQPKISFVSNPYLSEQEIQRLIFLKDPNPTNVDIEGVKLIERGDILDPVIPQVLGSFLLPEDVSFDIKSVEEGQSTYSFYLGKQLFPNLYLIGESAFEIDRVKRRFKLKFVPFPFIEFIGSLIDDPFLRRLEMAGDLIFKWSDEHNTLFTLLSDNKDAVKALQQKLPKVSYLRKSSFPALGEWARHNLKEAGFRDCKVDTICKIEHGDYCLRAEIVIDSGKKYVLNEILIEPKSVQLQINQAGNFWGKPCTDDLLRELKISAQLELLENGYYYRSSNQVVKCKELENLFSCQLLLVFDDPVAVNFNREVFQQGEHLSEFKKILVRDLTYLTDKLDLTRYAGSLNLLFFKNFNVNYNFKIRTHENSVSVKIEKLPFKIKVSEETPSGEKCSPLENLEGADLKEMLELANSEAEKCDKVIRKSSLTRTEPALYVLKIETSKTQRKEGLFIKADKKLDLPEFMEGDEVGVIQSVQSDLLRKGYSKSRLEVLESDGKKYLYVHDLEVQIIQEVHILSGSKFPSTLVEKLNKFRGQPASSDTFKSIKSMLIEEGFVQISAFDFNSQTGVLTIICNAAYSDELQIGGGFSSELGWHGLLIFSNQSWFSRGRTLKSKVDIYMEEDFSALNSGSIVFSFFDPSIKKSGLSRDYSLAFRRSVVSALPFNYENAKASVTADLHRAVTLNLSAGVDYNDLFDVASDFVFNKSDFIAPFLAAKIFDTSKLSPNIETQGWKWELESKLGFLDQNFFELKAMVGYRVNVVEDLYFHQSFNAGLINSFFGDYIEGPNRYFLGGRDSVRGYKLYGLGKSGEKGSPFGGERFFYVKSELIYEFMEDVGAVIFLDVGALDKLEADYGGIGSGLGLRYLTPIGPLGLDWARALLENSSSKENAFYFTIGFVF